MYLIKQIMLLINMLKNPEVKFWDKMKIILMILYIISPIDLIPAPVFGFSIIDDLIIMLFLLNLIKKLLVKYNYKDENLDINEDDVVENVKYEIDEDDKGDE
ncbi:MAG: DUF1232 domain-containing protein [Eubacteriales bacterium]